MFAYVAAAQSGDVDEMWRKLHERFGGEDVVMLSPDEILNRACSEVTEHGTCEELSIMMPHFDSKHLYNALSWAGWYGRGDMVDILLGKADEKGLQRCFDGACEAGFLEVMKRLEPHINFNDPNWSPLIAAATGGSVPVVSFLLPLCDPNALGGEALVQAIINKHPKVIDLLLPLTDLEANKGEALYQSISIQSEELVHRLIPYFNLNKDSGDMMNNAIRQRHMPIFYALVKHGGDTLLRNSTGHMSYAAQHKQAEMLDYILGLHDAKTQLTLLNKVIKDAKRDRTAGIRNALNDESLEMLTMRRDNLALQQQLMTEVGDMKPSAPKAKM